MVVDHCFDNALNYEIEVFGTRINGSEDSGFKEQFVARLNSSDVSIRTEVGVSELADFSAD